MCSEAFHITSPPKLVTVCIQRGCESPKRPSVGSLLNLPPLPPPSIPQDVNGVTVGVQRATTFPVSNNTNGGQWTDIHSLTDIAAQRTRRWRRSPPSKHPQKTKTKKIKKNVNINTVHTLHTHPTAGSLGVSIVHDHCCTQKGVHNSVNARGFKQSKKEHGAAPRQSKTITHREPRVAEKCKFKYTPISKRRQPEGAQLAVGTSIGSQCREESLTQSLF